MGILTLGLMEDRRFKTIPNKNTLKTLYKSIKISITIDATDINLTQRKILYAYHIFHPFPRLSLA